MSVTIYKFAKLFVTGKISAQIFSEAYMELWKIERDSGICREDPDPLSECLASVFCVADMYNPDWQREEYELDEESLKSTVESLLVQILIE